MTFIIDSKNNEVRTGSIIVRGLSVDVTVKETRTIMGKTRYLVVPVAGSGEIWVEVVYNKK